MTSIYKILMLKLNVAKCQNSQFSTTNLCDTIPVHPLALRWE